MDRELLLRARAGDREAFELIVLAKGEPLFRTALAILGNEADARDATQETFIRAWRGFAGLRDLERFDAWLGRILINSCRMALRHRGRVHEVAVADSTDSPLSANLRLVRLRRCLRPTVRRPARTACAPPPARLRRARDRRAGWASRPGRSSGACRAPATRSRPSWNADGRRSARSRTAAPREGRVVAARLGAARPAARRVARNRRAPGTRRDSTLVALGRIGRNRGRPDPARARGPSSEPRKRRDYRNRPRWRLQPDTHCRPRTVRHG